MRKPSVILSLLLLGVLCIQPCRAQSLDTAHENTAPKNTALENDDAPQAKAPTANPGRWITDPYAECKVWNQNPQPTESIRWKGDCEDGLASGQGSVQWYIHGHAGEYEEGHFVKGKLHGRGMMLLANGSRYEGEFAEYYFNGKGIIQWKDGRRYEGDWVKGRRTGHGVMQWPNGGHYEGDFFNNERTGKGVWTSAEGNRYEGEFLNGKYNGKGNMQWAKGNHYEGDWVAGSRTGRGVMTNANGERYEGCFRDGRLLPESQCTQNLPSLHTLVKSAGDTIHEAVIANAFNYAHLMDDGSTRALNDLHGYEIAPYVERVKKLVYANWHHLINSSGMSYRRRSGQAVVQFAITRDGAITKVKVVKTPHQGDLDGLFVQAISLSSPLPPLPKDLDRDEIILRFSAAYNPAAMQR